jgi:hypothetical protein
MRVFLICAMSMVICAGCKTSPTSAFPPHLTQPLKFASLTKSAITPEEVGGVMNEKVSMGDNGPEAYDILSKAGSKIHVETVNQYQTALKNGYFAATTYDMTMQSYFIQAEAVLDFMTHAHTSQRSYLGKQAVLDLPVTVLESFGEGGKEAVKGMTVRDCTPRVAKGVVEFRYQDCDYWVQELARGDVDHDGCEDVLLMMGVYAQGSGRHFQTLVATRTEPNQRQLQLIKFPSPRPLP